MPFDHFDRHKLVFKPLSRRENRVQIERDHVKPDDTPGALSPGAKKVIEETAARLLRARESDAARILAFGAHTIKNGLAPVLSALVEEGWLSHLATNGAGIIHDWEFAFMGASSEHVRGNMAKGEFGMWEETGRYLNLAIAVGAYEGLGYGESVGALVENESLTIPHTDALKDDMRTHMDDDPEKVAAAADLVAVMEATDVQPGTLAVPHPYKKFGIQAAAFRLGLPFTGHPMLGHDTIYMHPANLGAAVGRTGQRDFLRFAHSVAQLSGGVYLSLGSAVMSPMIFEKAMSMAQNVALQKGKGIDDHWIVSVDLAPQDWDWTKGEPPETNPAYYQRYNKTFVRMGGEMRYVQADNRDFLLGLYQTLQKG